MLDQFGFEGLDSWPNAGTQPQKAAAAISHATPRALARARPPRQPDHELVPLDPHFNNHQVRAVSPTRKKMATPPNASQMNGMLFRFKLSPKREGPIAPSPAPTRPATMSLPPLPSSSLHTSLPPLSSLYSSATSSIFDRPMLAPLPSLFAPPPLAQSPARPPSSIAVPATRHAPQTAEADLSALQSLASAATSFTQKDSTSSGSPPSKRRSDDDDLQFCFRCGKGGPVRKHRACMHEPQLGTKITKKQASTIKVSS